jgi:hypothetical protein
MNFYSTIKERRQSLLKNQLERGLPVRNAARRSTEFLRAKMPALRLERAIPGFFNKLGILPAI